MLTLPLAAGNTQLTITAALRLTLPFAAGHPKNIPTLWHLYLTGIILSWIIKYDLYSPVSNYNVNTGHWALTFIEVIRIGNGILEAQPVNRTSKICNIKCFNIHIFTAGYNTAFRYFSQLLCLNEYLKIVQSICEKNLDTVALPRQGREAPVE